MNLSVGIVGLPNVGKSTLFNALTNSTVDAQNYPFCTIEPNKGIVPIRDKRLDNLSKIEKSERTIYSTIEFVDIAGLVKGASTGAGLGNQFLSNIREVAVIAHIVRDFENGDVIHVEGKIDPASDIETIELELILKDIETVKKRIESQRGKARTDKKEQEKFVIIENLLAHLESGKMANSFETEEDDLMRELSLLTSKPQIYVFNRQKDSPFNTDISEKLKPNLSMDIKLEYEISTLSDDEKQEFLNEFGMETTGLESLSKACFDLLGLICFFTSGKTESRAWTIKKDMPIEEAAGTIHTDFTKKFIAADVVAYDDFVKYNGWAGAKEAGKIRLEGKGYKVKDGDVVIIRHG